MPPSFITVVVACALAIPAVACNAGPVVADSLGTVQRIRVDVMEHDQQFFVDKPDDVARILKGIGMTQKLRTGSRFNDTEFPTVGLTFFDPNGTPRATLNFAGPIGPHNELYAIGAQAEFLGSLTPADPDLIKTVIAHNAPP